VKVKIFIPFNLATNDDAYPEVITSVSPLCIDRLVSDRSFEKTFNGVIRGKDGLARVV
jgi:hypothetical protein